MGSFVLPEAFLTFIGTYPHYSISLLVYRLVHAPVISLTARKRGSTPRQRECRLHLTILVGKHAPDTALVRELDFQFSPKASKQANPFRTDRQRNQIQPFALGQARAADQALLNYIPSRRGL